jgi:hypothetical protein
MPYFDRFDICEAYTVFEWHWQAGGWLQFRDSNRRRMEATHVQLDRMRFRPRPNLEFENLSENGRAIYRQLIDRYGLRKQWAANVVAECRDRDAA